jgi:hypothetical protein
MEVSKILALLAIIVFVLLFTDRCGRRNDWQRNPDTDRSVATSCIYG